MKILIFSDLHLHPFTYGARTLDNGYNSRLWDQKLALDQIVEYVRDHAISTILFGGDLFHVQGSVPTTALSVAGGFFHDLAYLEARITLLVGNHDFANRSGSINALSPFFVYPRRVTAPGHRDIFSLGEVEIAALSYTEDDDLIKRFFEEVNNRQIPLAIMHQGVAGIPLSSGKVLDERLTPEMVPDTCRVFTGHYHYHRAVTPNLTVIGNLTAQNWSDIDQEKGFLVYDTTTQTTEFIATKAPRFITQDVSSPLSECAGNFVRYASPIEKGEIAGVREKLVEAGAITVEFPVVVEEAGGLIKQHQVDVFDARSYIDELEENMDDRRWAVGEETRNGNYEN